MERQQPGHWHARSRLAAACSLLCVAVVAIVVRADYPPVPGSGGQPCKVDAHCGIPAANCPSLREECSSLTGNCVGGFCACNENMWCCGNCAGQAHVVRNSTDPTQFEYTSLMDMLDGSGRQVDLCSVPLGGSPCSDDVHCGNKGGMCIAGMCVCPQGNMCGDCSITLTDLLYGLRCGIPDGGGSCTTNDDCGNGTCLISPGGFPPPFCQCNALYACPHCSRWVPDLASNKTVCP
eukprot:m.188387 g.188387  ORF g.188387 m.188387 type:complete len:235 (+) comp17535_c3_seq9:2559-3263(+)